MSGMALGLVLAAAFLHATWNYLTKISQVKLIFIWWFLLISGLLYFPLFLYFWNQTTITTVGWTCIIATSVLHALNFGFLGMAYEVGDLPGVYPLSRGALGTGGTIVFYSLGDKIGVSNVYPPVYIYLMFVGAFILLSPYVLVKKRLLLFEEWQKNKCAILAVGFLALFTYLLVLFAMQMSKVSYIVALRESGILFSALYGTFWLRESHRNQKIVGAILIFLGVFFIGLSR